MDSIFCNYLRYATYLNIKNAHGIVYLFLYTACADQMLDYDNTLLKENDGTFLPEKRDKNYEGADDISYNTMSTWLCSESLFYILFHPSEFSIRNCYETDNLYDILSFLA